MEVYILFEKNIIVGKVIKITPTTVECMVGTGYSPDAKINNVNALNPIEFLIFSRESNNKGRNIGDNPRQMKNWILSPESVEKIDKLYIKLEKMFDTMDKIKTCHIYVSIDDELSFNTFEQKWPGRVHKCPWFKYGQIAILIQEDFYDISR